MGILDSKVALIAGPACDQVRAQAALFLEEGAEVIVADNSGDQGLLAGLALGPSATYTQIDVSADDDWDQLVAEAGSRFGRLDVVVNNTEVLPSWYAIEARSVDDHLGAIESQPIGCWLVMKKTIPLLLGSCSGSIVNVAIQADPREAAWGTAYEASRWFTRNLTKSAALELGPTGIRVNSIHPGFPDTSVVRPHGTTEPSEALRSNPALGRVPTLDAVAAATVFLASDAAACCTGVELVVDPELVVGEFHLSFGSEVRSE